MALRDQPYLPLYIQDIMTDEKLNECSAATHGIYIKGIMCLMHKSEQYGKLLLKQKDKQTTNQIKNFAIKCDKHLPYTIDQIEVAINELVTEGVLHIVGDSLCQKRMIKDNTISELRSKAGSKGGSKSKDFVQAKSKANTQANTQANSEYVYEDEIENKNVIEIGKKKEYQISIKKVFTGDKVKIIYDLSEYFKSSIEQFTKAGWTMFDGFMKANPSRVFDDDDHLYNSFKKFHEVAKSGTNGRKFESLEDLRA